MLVATGARPRVVAGAETDGERILDWRQLYDLPELPEHLVVVGSGVTGAEFAGAYDAMGSRVTLVSSRERVLPGEDSDAAELLQQVFARRGMEIRRGRAARVDRHGDGVRVTLTDGSVVEASHCLMTVGSVPNTGGLGLEEVGVRLTEQRLHRRRPRLAHLGARRLRRRRLHRRAHARQRRRHAGPDRDVARPRRGRPAAAAAHRRRPTSSPTRRSPRSASRSSRWSRGEVAARAVTLPLGTNARAKMQGITDGFVKFFCRPGTGTVLGGVVVAPSASELIMPISLAVQHGLTVDQIAHTFAIYPSLSGSVTEAARRLMLHGEEG